MSVEQWRRQLLDAHRRPARDRHDGVHRLAPALVRDRDDGRLGDRRMAVQRLLHLGAVDVLAARHDHVLRAVDEEQEALLVEVAQVPGHVPAVAQRRLRLRGLVPVAGGDVLAPDLHLADLAGRARLAGHRVDRPHLDADRALPAGQRARAVQEILLAGHERHDRRRLRRAVDVHEVRGRERRAEPAQQLGRRRRRAVAQPAQRGHVARRAGLLGGERLHHRRHDERRGDRLALDEIEEAPGVERAEHDVLATRPDRRQRADRARRRGRAARRRASSSRA